MNLRVRVIAGLAAIAVLSAALVFGDGVFGWASIFRDDSKASFESVKPAYVMGFADPEFGPECGEDRFDIGTGGGYSFNSDLEYHTRRAVAIVEGTAREAGPARYGDLVYQSDMDQSQAFEVAEEQHTVHYQSFNHTQRTGQRGMGGLRKWRPCRMYQLQATQH